MNLQQDSPPVVHTTDAVNRRRVASSRPEVLRVLLGLAVVFAGGDRQPWVYGLALVLMGVGVWLRPPDWVLPTRQRWVLLALLLLPLLHFMPSGLLGPPPPWREMLIQEWGITPSPTSASQWMVSLESWFGLVVAVGWFMASIRGAVADHAPRDALRLLAAGVALLALLSLMERAQWISLPWWPRGLAGGPRVEGFGPFANPNHSSSLFALGLLWCAAAAQDALRRRESSGWLHGLGGLACAACVMVNSSRAGLLLGLLGMTLWLGTIAIRGGKRVRLVVLFAVVLASVSVVMLSGGRAGQRLLGSSLGSQLSSDLRGIIARESAWLCLNHPWLGRGLGGFGWEFGLQSRGGLSESRVIHPESDLLWGLFEGGLVVVLPTVFLLGWLLRCGESWWEPRRRHHHGSASMRRIRRTLGLSVLLALVHGLVDVPLHHFAYGTLLAIALGMSIRPETLRVGHDFWTLLLSRLCALLTLGWGLAWVHASVRGQPPPLASGALWCHDRAVESSRDGRFRQALKWVNEAIERTPLEYRWYFLRAQLHLVMRQDQASAMEDFGRARTLEPHLALMCMEEGAFWLRYDPSMALVPWEEALRRYPENSHWASLRYREMMVRSEGMEELRESLWRLAAKSSWQLIFLQLQEAGELWQRCQNEFLLRHPGLSDLSESQARFFLLLWENRGSAADAAAYLTEHPDLVEVGWPLMARAKVRDADFRGACELVMRHQSDLLQWNHVEVGQTGLSVAALQRAVVLNPLDARRAVELIKAQWAIEDWSGALNSVERASALPQAPAILLHAKIALLVKLQRHREAWELMQPLVGRDLPMAADDGGEDHSSPMTWARQPVSSPLPKPRRDEGPSGLN